MAPSNERYDTVGPEGVRGSGNAPTGGKRRAATLQLDVLIRGLVKRWGKEGEFALWKLRTEWDSACDEPWMRFVRPESIDSEARLYVSAPHSPGAAMEIRNKGVRWKRLLESCRRAAGFHFTDLILDSRSRRPADWKSGARKG